MCTVLVLHVKIVNLASNLDLRTNPHVLTPLYHLAPIANYSTNCDQLVVTIS